MFYAFFTLSHSNNGILKEWMELRKAEDKATCIKLASEIGVIYNMIELTKEEFYDLLGKYPPETEITE